MEKPDPIKVKQKMSAKDLQLLHMEYSKQKKSTGIAYLLWFFLGGFGIHQAYLGRTDLVGVHLGAVILFLISIASGSMEFMGIAFIWVMVSAGKLIYDLFYLGEQVKQTNAKIEAKVISSIQG